MLRFVSKRKGEAIIYVCFRGKRNISLLYQWLSHLFDQIHKEKQNKTHTLIFYIETICVCVYLYSYMFDKRILLNNAYPNMYNAIRYFLSYLK